MQCSTGKGQRDFLRRHLLRERLGAASATATHHRLEWRELRQDGPDVDAGQPYLHLIHGPLVESSKQDLTDGEQRILKEFQEKHARSGSSRWYCSTAQ